MQGVRLIACDLDGTLLDEAKQLPAELPELVKRLKTRGVVFCPASGRQYHTIREQFAPICSGIPVSFSEDDCTRLLGVTPVVQGTFDSFVSAVVCTNLDYAQYLCAPKRAVIFKAKWR